jgi:hypothetical protein
MYMQPSSGGFLAVFYPRETLAAHPRRQWWVLGESEILVWWNLEFSQDRDYSWTW